MNKKQKIVVSILSIMILFFIVIGLTYAYFVTNIQGNPNNTSIIMTSANLRLVYGDGNGLIEAINIQPGDNIEEKTFTVTNTGTVTIENYGIYLENITNTFVNNNDVAYSLTCSSNKSKSCSGITNQVFPNYNELLVINSIDKDEVQSYSLKVSYLDSGTDQSIDMNKKLKAKVQIYNTDDVINITGKVQNYNEGDYIKIGNSISPINKDGIYKIVGIPIINNTIFLYDKDNNIIGQKDIYINRVIGSSSIESNTINVNNYSKIVNVDISKGSSNIIINIKSIENYNKNITGTLINKIFINSNSNAELNTKQTNNPINVLGNPSGNEKEFIPTNDNYGVSYYYRGKVVDNYVNYKGMCFRIVRIEGDGSIKVILADPNNTCDSSNYSLSNSSLINTSIYGNDQNNIPNFVNSNNNSIYNKLNLWYSEHFVSEQHKLKNNTWCLGNMDNKYSDITYELTPNINYLYDNTIRVINKTPTLLCSSSSKKYRGYISSLTVDELVFAGLSADSTSTSYILDNTLNDWWTISSRGFQNNIGNSYIVSNKLIDNANINEEKYIRPVITLNARIYAGGSGTINDPYVIE